MRVACQTSTLTNIQVEQELIVDQNRIDGFIQFDPQQQAASRC